MRSFGVDHFDPADFHLEAARRAGGAARVFTEIIRGCDLLQIPRVDKKRPHLQFVPP